MGANGWQTAFMVGAVVVFVAVALLWRGLDRSRPARAAGLGLVMGLTALHQLMYSTSAEDAFITYRYAENLAQGHGLVFNVGDRVEGYSNFLWTVLIAAPRATFGMSVVSTARVLGFGLTLGLVMLVYRLARVVGGDARSAVVAATLTAVSGTIAAYGPAGLETPLFGVLVLGAVLAVLAGRPVLAGALLGLATMTRPDGLVVILVVVVWLLQRGGPTVGERLRTVGRVLMPVAVLLVPWTVWRVAYYGHLVPNAMAAKAGGPIGFQLRSGIDYAESFLLSYQSLAVLVVAAAALLWSVDRRRLIDRSGPLALLAGVLVVVIVFTIVVGGDWMPAYRFFYLVPPLAAVLVAPAVVHASRPGASTLVSRAGLLVALTVGALLVVTSVSDDQMLPSVRTWSEQVEQLGEIGSWFHDALPARTELAVFANGALSYRAGSDLVMIDVLGLTDEHIAREGDRAVDGSIGHLANDWPYVAERAPALMYLGGGGFETMAICVVDGRVGDGYRPATFRVVGTDRWVDVLVRADLYDEVVTALSRNPRFEFVPCPGV